MADPLSRISTSFPLWANDRAVAKPTTPAPIIATSARNAGEIIAAEAAILDANIARYGHVCSLSLSTVMLL